VGGSGAVNIQIHPFLLSFFMVLRSVFKMKIKLFERYGKGIEIFGNLKAIKFQAPTKDVL
jgi:hypothetical protein